MKGTSEYWLGYYMAFTIGTIKIYNFHNVFPPGGRKKEKKGNEKEWLTEAQLRGREGEMLQKWSRISKPDN